MFFLPLRKKIKESEYKTEQWPKNAAKVFEANVKTTYALMQSVDNDALYRVISCESAYEI